jgi:hypothetical protein
MKLKELKKRIDELYNISDRMGEVEVFTKYDDGTNEPLILEIQDLIDNVIFNVNYVEVNSLGEYNCSFYTSVMIHLVYFGKMIPIENLALKLYKFCT